MQMSSSFFCTVWRLFDSLASLTFPGPELLDHPSLSPIEWQSLNAASRVKNYSALQSVAQDSEGLSIVEDS